MDAYRAVPVKFFPCEWKCYDVPVRVSVNVMCVSVWKEGKKREGITGGREKAERCVRM